LLEAPVPLFLIPIYLTSDHCRLPVGQITEAVDTILENPSGTTEVAVAPPLTQVSEDMGVMVDQVVAAEEVAVVPLVVPVAGAETVSY
jgi:hypothetical protein